MSMIQGTCGQTRDFSLTLILHPCSMTVLRTVQVSSQMTKGHHPWRGLLTLVPNQTVQPSFFVIITDGGHHDNVSTRKHEKEHMAKTSQIPFYVRLGNALTLTLLRADVVLKRSPQENCLQARRTSLCEKMSRVATLSLATMASPRTLPLRSLSVRWSAIRCLCWKGNSPGTPGGNIGRLPALEGYAGYLAHPFRK